MPGRVWTWTRLHLVPADPVTTVLEFRQTEVQHLRIAIFAQHEVLGLDCAMINAGLSAQRALPKLARHLQNRAELKRSFARDAHAGLA